MIRSVPESMVETLPGSWAPAGSRPIDLVFHTAGERTSELALELALKHLKPHRAHVIRGTRPEKRAEGWLPRIDSDCSHVVSVAANCLILEDLRPFIDANELPMVGCYGQDRFRGRAYCGVHITRIDVARAICAAREPLNNLAYLLGPDEHLRKAVLRRSGFEMVCKNFHILSDYFQCPSDIFATYALRGLRNRTGPEQTHRVELLPGRGSGGDFAVARHALEHVARAVPPDATLDHVERYLRELPELAQTEMHKLGFGPTQGDQADMTEVHRAVVRGLVDPVQPRKKVKVFGIGLSRTGTHSLTRALHVLGFDTVHYPTDRGTLDTLMRGDTRFPLLDHYDGITDITTAPYYEDLDLAWPGSKFVLTVRDEDSWLSSCRGHWASLPNFRYGGDDEHRTFMEVLRFLEAAVYASNNFNEERFRRAYRRHVHNVTSYFKGRERDLLVLDVVGGDGYGQLAPFLDLPVPERPFPHRGMKGGY